LGYLEGKNITYIYHGSMQPDPQVIAREVQSLRDQKVDVFLTLGTLPTLAAKQATANTDIPVVFAPVINPVEEGVVSSLTRPSGHVTGVQNGDALPKAMEWLHKIVPQATQVHVIYHPQDSVARTATQSLSAIASALGVELVVNVAHNHEEAQSVIATLPNEAAIFLVPTPSLSPLSVLIEAAINRGIAVGADNPVNFKAGGLFVYTADYAAMGQQAARLTDQIFKGTQPADLPVETAEYFLRINLQTAKAINLDIPDEILRQASSIMR
jgi:putative ABC transport system substrate-binding protein